MDPLLDSWSPDVVFTPSQANKRNTDAKDWDYITKWLARRFSPLNVPPFERTPETLKALLELATANEKADELARLARNVKAKGLEEAKAKAEASLLDPHSPLRQVEEALPEEMSKTLDTLALLSVALGTRGSRIHIYKGLNALTRTEATLHLQTHTLNTHLQTLTSTLSTLHDPAALPRPPTDLSLRTTEWDRTLREVLAKRAEYDVRLAALQREWEGSRGRENLIPGLIEEEGRLEEMKGEVGRLEARVKGFGGLPVESGLARGEVERVQGELDALVRQREELYAKMGAT